MNSLVLSDSQETELRRLLGFYKKETERCRNAKAYLAGCVMAGAELETALLLMVNAFAEDAAATGKLPRRHDEVKPLPKWNLSELLRVAKAAGWLPSALEHGKDEWSAIKAKIGDHTEVIRDLRNLAHPIRYMEDHYKKRITKKHLEYVLEIINMVSGWLYARIEESLIEKIRQEERAAAPNR